MKKLFILLLCIISFISAYSQDTLLSNQVIYNTNASGRYFSSLYDTLPFSGYIADYYYDINLKKTSVKFLQKVEKGLVVSATAYYENRIQKDYTEYVKGIEHGVYKEWYESGQLKKEGLYNKGNKTGVWITYYSNGNKESMGKYKKDKKIGKWELWTENGKVRNW